MREGKWEETKVIFTIRLTEWGRYKYLLNVQKLFFLGLQKFSIKKAHVENNHTRVLYSVLVMNQFLVSLIMKTERNVIQTVHSSVLVKHNGS